MVCSMVAALRHGCGLGCVTDGFMICFSCCVVAVAAIEGVEEEEEGGWEQGADSRSLKKGPWVVAETPAEEKKAKCSMLPLKETNGHWNYRPVLTHGSSDCITFIQRCSYSPSRT